MLPIHSCLWLASGFGLSLCSFWFDIDVSSDSVDFFRLYMHVTGDFGTSGLPRTFKIFFSDVVVRGGQRMKISFLSFRGWEYGLRVIEPCNYNPVITL